MGARERVAYLKGLMDGRGAGDSPFEAALLSTLEALCDELDEIRDQYDSSQEDLAEMDDQIDRLDSHLFFVMDHLGITVEEDSVEDYMEAIDAGSQFVKVSCPQCEDQYFVPASTMEEGEARCPQCGDEMIAPGDVEQNDG